MSKLDLKSTFNLKAGNNYSYFRFTNIFQLTPLQKLLCFYFYAMNSLGRLRGNFLADMNFHKQQASTLNGLLQNTSSMCKKDFTQNTEIHRAGADSRFRRKNDSWPFRDCRAQNMLVRAPLTIQSYASAKMLRMWKNDDIRIQKLPNGS
jgi:hypothetical protein